MKAVFVIAMVGIAMSAQGATNDNMILSDGGFRFSLSRVNDPNARGTLLGGSGGETGFTVHEPGDPTLFAAEDYTSLQQQWWWYRANGDTREYALSNQQSYTQHSAGHAELVYSEPSSDAADALRFTLNYTLNGNLAQGKALTVAHWKIENTSGVDQTVSFFTFADVRAGGLFPSPADAWSYTSYGTHSEFRVNDSVDTDEPFMTVGTLGNLDAQNDLWGASGLGGIGPQFSFSTLANSDIDNAPHANTTPSPLTTIGSAGIVILQWNLLIPAGGSAEGNVYVGYNATVPAPAGAFALLSGAFVMNRRRRS